MARASRGNVALEESVSTVGVAGTYATASYPFIFSAPNTYLAATFSYGVAVEPEFGRALNPPVSYTTEDEPFRLQINTTLTSISGGLPYLNLYTLIDTASGLLAGTVQDFNDWAVIEVNVNHADTEWELQDDGTYSLIFPIEFDTTYLEFISGNDFEMYTRVRSTLWDGRFSFVMDSPRGITITSITWNGWSVPFNTGWEGHTAYEGRPVWDMKTGLPTFAQDCTEDGYYYGIWTAANSWDADYPPNLQPVELPDSEGEIDDDYPQ